MAKMLAYTRPSIRKIKTKAGGIRQVAVKGHMNKINRKPRAK